jgi:hypothetical protein
MRTASAYRLALFGIGVALATFGILHLIGLLTNAALAYPAEKTCIQVGPDSMVCYIYPWAPGPLVAVIGIALMLLAVWLGRRIVRKPPVRGEG